MLNVSPTNWRAKDSHQNIPDMFWTSMYVESWVFTFTGFTRILAEVKNDSFTNNKIECYAWDAETIDSSKSFQSLQSRSIAIETKKIEMAFVLVFRHFIIILTFFFSRFWRWYRSNWLDLLLHFRVETKGLSYGLFFTWPKNVRDMSRIPHKINDNWRRWPSLPSAAAATVVSRLHCCCCFNFFCEEEPNAIFCNNTQPTHCFTLKTSYEFQFRPLLINRWH